MYTSTGQVTLLTDTTAVGHCPRIEGKNGEKGNLDFHLV